METKLATYRHAFAERRESGSVLEVTPDVTCIRLSIVNAYLVGSRGAPDGSWVLVDAGLYLSSERILRAARERFGENSRPAAIVLTHAHFDHVGSLRELAELWDVPIYCHYLELPYVTGRASYPPPDPTVEGGAMARMSFLYPRRPLDLAGRVSPLPGDGSVPGMPGWRWIHTPGHTPGHVAFFRESDRTLIAGDAFVTTRQESMLCALAQPEEVNGPPAYFTPDWEAARRSVEELARLEPEIAATGHGHPMSGDRLRSELHALARDFEHLAVPAHGRYVRQPARFDDEGIPVSVPPPVVDPRMVIAAGVGVGVLAGVALAVSGARSRRTGRLGKQVHSPVDDRYWVM